ncbi:hypothetical protein BROUX41_006236 [Berkeleyomyces rouxiae]
MGFLRSQAKLSPLNLSNAFWSAALVAFVSRSALASPVISTSPELPVPESVMELPAFITPPPTGTHPYDEEAVLVVDTVRPLFVNGQWKLVDDVEWELRKRMDDSETDFVSVSTSQTSTAANSEVSADSSQFSTSTSPQTSATSTTTSTPTEEESGLPSPMDENLNYNFTTNGGKSCPAFLNALLTDDQFIACYPISMLLKGSYSFFTAQRELQSIVSVLDATCDVDFNMCNAYLKKKAIDLTSPENCAEEYRDDGSNIMMVYWGLIAYEPLYKATCVRDPETSMYCYADAVTNKTTGNAYTYFMPLNSSLPLTAEPACTQCLQQTMAVFQTFTNDASQPLAYNYGPAAKVINSVCGSGFVNQTSLKIKSKSGTVPKANGTRTSAGGGKVASMPTFGTLGSTVAFAALMTAALAGL